METPSTSSQIVNGTADETEDEALTLQCKQAAMKGLWLLYRELIVGQAESAREIIELIEEDPVRLRQIEQHL